MPYARESLLKLNSAPTYGEQVIEGQARSGTGEAGQLLRKLAKRKAGLPFIGLALGLRLA